MSKKQNYKRNANGMIVCTVYRRYVDMPGSQYHLKSYVGITDDMKTRDQKHRSNKTRYAGHKYKEARNAVPLENWKKEILEVFEVATAEEYDIKSEDRESFYIAKFNSYYDGLNGNLGGSGNKGVKLDEARRKQNGDNRRGKPQPRESVERGAAKRRGRKQSEETCRKKSEAMKGKKHTPEQNANQSQRMKGKEPKAATAGAKLWREQNGGGSWLGKNIPPEAIEKKKETVRKSSQRIKVISPDGTVNCYLCQTDAAKATGVKDGSIKYALDNNGFHRASGYTFERITDAEYQAWKSQNP